MNEKLTDVTLVIDRSGSMEASKQEAENGINHFIEEQRKQDGDCVLSLVQFDNEYEFVHKATPISEVGRFELEPRGMTALLDAVGRAANETGDRLSKMNESERPGLVAFVIVTDGLENASQEFNRQQIKEMIERQTNDYQWKFTFLGANQNAFAEAASLGIGQAAAANYAASASIQAFDAAASNVSRMRSATARGDTASCEYTDDERASMLTP